MKNDTDAFEAWENPPAHIYMQFYFFNVTNPLEVLDGERPAVVEVGPYTYRWAQFPRFPREQANLRWFRLTRVGLNPHSDGELMKKQM